MKKKYRVLFLAYSGKQWMGGVYYVKNIVYQFLEYAKTVTDREYLVYIYLDKSVLDIFSFCKDNDNVELIIKKNYPWNSEADNGFVARNLRELGWILRIYGKKIDYIYPSFSEKSIYRKRILSWIPDFQHVEYPDFFSEEEITSRDKYYGRIARYHSNLILSSNHAYEVYEKLYPQYLDSVSVVHFVSAIKDEDIEKDRESLLKIYNINDPNFFIVSNQFYRHKNHILVFEAIKQLKDNGIDNIQLICTGMTYDLKDESYKPEYENFISKNGLEKNIRILGLIPRKHQLGLMRVAKAVIQPSLYEGWGTCTEDAKTLGKIIVLSDIPVHREQANEDTLFFDKKSSKQLAEVMRSIWEENYGKDMIGNVCVKNAVEYGKQFAKAIHGE